MKRFAALYLCLAPLAIADVMAPPAPFTARYDVHHSGARIGETTLSLSRTPDTDAFELTNRTEPRGIAALVRRRDVVETSLFEIESGRVVPRTYDFDDGSRKGKRNSRVAFDWAAGTAVSEYKSQTATHTLADGTLDRLVAQIALMRDAGDGLLPREYRILDRNALKTYQVELLGEEMLPTPAGQFDTVRLRRQRTGSSRATLIWLAPKLDYLPIKMVQLKDERPNVVLTLTEYSAAR